MLPEFQVQEELRSFQQRVWRVEMPGQGAAILKQIISDYSWWTFDDCDVYRRETASHVLLAQLSGTQVVLNTNDTERRFLMRWLDESALNKDDPSPLLGRLLELLEMLRRGHSPALQKLMAMDLAALFYQRGAQAGVKTCLLDEVSTLLQKWERIYGTATCFVHGDLHPGNFRQGKDGALYPIDFEETIESLPALDGAELSAALYFRLNPEAQQLFQAQYEKRFGEPLIAPQEWRRFCHLRGWIASCYLRECCPTSLQELARNFLIENEPPVTT